MNKFFTSLLPPPPPKKRRKRVEFMKGPAGFQTCWICDDLQTSDDQNSRNVPQGIWFSLYRVQEIFEWIFEVEDDAGEEDPGRLVLSLEYEMDSKNKETYGSTENKVVAQVPIQHDNVYTIVPVIKVSTNLCAWKNERRCTARRNG